MTLGGDGSFSWTPVSPPPRQSRRYQFSATLYRADGTVHDLYDDDPVPELEMGDRMFMSFRPIPEPLWRRPAVLAVCALVTVGLWILVAMAV